MRVKIILCILPILVLRGCMSMGYYFAVTPYRPFDPNVGGNVGGYTDELVGENIYEVTVYGNFHTAQFIVESIAKVRAAEIALASGYAYFRILDQFTHTIEDFSIGEHPILVRKYSVYIKIKLTNDPNDIDAQETLDTLGPAAGYKPHTES